MAAPTAPTPVPAGLYDKSIIDHRRLANNEHSFPDVFFAVDEKKYSGGTWICSYRTVASTV